MYFLGVQYSIWTTRARAEREYDKAIAGDQSKKGNAPGLVWTWSHQVAGISKGIEFTRVDGPGLIFTDQYESPVALVDLRTQSRSSLINTVTKDGMEIPVRVAAAFAIDREKWPRQGWDRARFAKIKFIIGKNYEIDRPIGSYPYSTGRIRSLLGKAGVSKIENEMPEVYWDEWVLKQVEHAARPGDRTGKTHLR